MKVFEDENVSLYLSEMEIIEHIKGLQDVTLYMHPTLGKVLVINNEIQHVEKWAPIYHEAITHIPLMFIKEPQKVLIIGGGDLYAADILLQYPSIQRIDICDHDINVINLTIKHYAHGYRIDRNAKVNFIIEDAKTYLFQTVEKYDVIIDDCFNLVADFSSDQNIFTHLSNMLNNDGVCCSLVYRHIFDSAIMKSTIQNLFGKEKTVFSLIAVPEYPGFLHMLTIWGKSNFLSQDMKTTKNKWQIDCINQNKSCGELFNPKFCEYYLYVPYYLKRCIEEHINA